MSSEELKYRPTQELVCELTQYLIQSGAENYIEDSYTLTLDTGLQCDAVVTVQYTSQPTPHELRLQAEQERDAARAQLAAIQGGMGDVPAASQYRIGVNGEWLYSNDRKYLQRERDEYESQCEPGDCDHETPEPIYSLADVQRITAAMAVEVERLRKDRKACWEQYKVLGRDYDRLRAELDEVTSKNKD